MPHYLINPRELEALSPIFRGKIGGKFNKFCLHLTKLDVLNSIHDTLFEFKGADFARHMLEWCKVSYQVSGLDILDKLQPPFITVSNHAYGGADGIVLIDLFGNRFPEFKVMVNEILTRIEAMKESFISVTPMLKGAVTPTAQSISGIRQSIEHIKDGNPLGLFPSGAVSDFHMGEWLLSKNKESVTAYDRFSQCTRDREWQDSVIRLIQKVKVPVVPVRFFDINSVPYYLLGLVNHYLRLLRLPTECLNKAGKTFRVGIGQPISVEQQGCASIEELKMLLRASVYQMPLPKEYVTIL